MAIGDKLPVVMGREKATPGGVATLGSDGILSESQRPAYTAEQVKAADLTLSNLTNPQQALANLGAGVRPNLADNCDFTNPVNQVGFSTKTASADFSIFDRWAIQASENSITATLTGSGLQIDETGSNQGVRQPIEGKKFTGSVFTSSAIIDGKLYTAQLEKVPVTGQVVQYPGSEFYCALTQSGDNWLWYPFADYKTVPRTITISHCKLEEGEGQTLAYEDADGAWQLLPQPDMKYGAQLAECQRYLQVYKNIVLSGGSSSDGTRLFLQFPLLASMRIRPVISGLEVVYASIAGTRIDTGFDTYSVQGDNNMPYLQFNMSDLSVSQPAFAYLSSIELSAEL